MTLRREEPRTFAVTRQSTRLVSSLGPIPGQPLECICHCNPRIATAPPDEVDFRSDVPTVMGMSSRAYFLVRVQEGGADTEIIPMIPGLAHAIASALRAGGGGGSRRQCRRGRDQHNDLAHVLTPVLSALNAKPPHDHEAVTDFTHVWFAPAITIGAPLAEAMRRLDCPPFI